MPDMTEGQLTASRDWLIGALANHSNVESVTPVGDSGISITRKNGDEIQACFTGKYVFSEFELAEMRRSHPDVNCVVMGSSWLRYTVGAKECAKDQQIGLFTVNELFGALNRRHKFWQYVPKKK